MALHPSVLETMTPATWAGAYFPVIALSLAISAEGEAERSDSHFLNIFAACRLTGRLYPIRSAVFVSDVSTGRCGALDFFFFGNFIGLIFSSLAISA
jgi:hypothetical protein